jgi:hypothetical protein
MDRISGEAPLGDRAFKNGQASEPERLGGPCIGFDARRAAVFAETDTHKSRRRHRRVKHGLGLVTR